MSRPLAGRLIVALGVVHTLASLPPLAEALPYVIGRGIIGGVATTVPPPVEALGPLATLFSLVMGALLLLLGGVVHRLEAAGLPLPGWLGPSLAATGLVSGLLIPPTGFWLVLALGLWVTWRARAAAGERAAAG